MSIFSSSPACLVLCLCRPCTYGYHVHGGTPDSRYARYAAILLAPWITNLALWSRIHAKVWMDFLLGQHGALGHPCCSSQKSAEVCHSSMVSATRACHGHHPLWLRSYQRQPLDRPFCPSPLRALGQNPSPFFPRRFAVRLCG